MTLEQRTAKLKSQIAELKADRASAVLAGSKYDSTPISALETELAAMQDAEGEQTRRQRILAQESQVEHTSKLKAQYEGERAQYLAAVEVAERAAREMAASFREALDRAALMRSVLATLHHVERTVIPTSLDANEIGRRLSERLSTLLRGILHPLRFGTIQLHVGALDMGENPATQNWADAERRQSQFADINTKEAA